RVELVGCCNRQGSLAAQITLAEQGVLPGDSAKIKIMVANGGNQRNKTHRQELGLWQQISFRSLYRGDMKSFDRKVVRTAVRNRQSKVDHGNQQLEFPIPPTLPPTSTTDTGLVTVSYFFKLDLGVGTLELIVPVVVGRHELPGDEKQ
uniref:Arrestin C-terminal-like domain-containing protein n=1 Tax=Plectus sambesii TaxID=2011161 RepID=A0A914WIC7_9BILA